MLSNMNGVLEQLGLGALKRAVHVQFSHAALNAQVFYSGLRENMP